MARMIVTVAKLNRRSSPVANVGDKTNIVSIVNRGFSFDSITQVNNAAGAWYGDDSGYFYWGGGLKNDDSSLTSTLSSNVNNLTPDVTCFDFIKQHEGLQLQAYQDSAGVWTIGYGTIMYEDKTPVKRGDVITQQSAEHLLQIEIVARSTTVSVALADTPVNQHQYDALVSFSFNVGSGGFLSSTLLKRVKSNVNDLTIRDAFLMWDKATVDGVLTEIAGLKKRREDEADLYFS